MYWAIKMVLIDVWPNTGAEYPEVHGPFATSEEQKAWIRAECAKGNRVYWLDVDVGGKPHAGRVTKVDGQTELA